MKILTKIRRFLLGPQIGDTHDRVSDLAIDTLVYVRDSEEKAWVPRYYAGFDYETNQVKVWINGTTSITTNGMTTCWKYCKLGDVK